MYGDGAPTHPPITSSSNFSLLQLLLQDKLNRPNYLDWIHSLKVSLSPSDMKRKRMS